MNIRYCYALSALVLGCISFSSFAGNKGGDLYDQQDSVGSDVAFDMMVGRASQTQPTYTITMGNADTGQVTATFNGVSKTVTVQKAGQSSVVSFNMLAQYQFPGDAASQTGFVNDLTSLAMNRDLLVSFESYSFRSGVGFNDDGVVEPACALVPCRREIDPADPSNTYWVTTYQPDWLVGVTPLPPGSPSYPGYSPEIVAYDMARWEQARNQACGRAGRNALESWASIIGTGASCALAETGLGAIGCGAGLALVGTTVADAAEDERTCNRPYPGPGKW